MLTARYEYELLNDDELLKLKKSREECHRKMVTILAGNGVAEEFRQELSELLSEQERLLAMIEDITLQMVEKEIKAREKRAVENYRGACAYQELEAEKRRPRYPSTYCRCRTYRL